MSTFNTRPSAAVRVTVFAASVLMATLCLGTALVSLTWDASGQIADTQNTSPAQA
jgi:hypothetical protein